MSLVRVCVCACRCRSSYRRIEQMLSIIFGDFIWTIERIDCVGKCTNSSGMCDQMQSEEDEINWTSSHVCGRTCVDDSHRLWRTRQLDRPSRLTRCDWAGPIKRERFQWRGSQSSFRTNEISTILIVNMNIFWNYWNHVIKMGKYDFAMIDRDRNCLLRLENSHDISRIPLRWP